MFEINFFVTQNRKLFSSKSKMKDFIGESIVNKVCIWIPNCHRETNFKVFDAVSSFYYIISTDFSQKTR